MSQGIHRGSASTIRVALNEEAFAALVAGDMATVRGVTADGTVTVEIILSDIGWETMRRLLDAAERRSAPGGLRIVEVMRGQRGI